MPRIVYRPVNQWPGSEIGVHRLEPTERELEAALDTADRDGFETVYVYLTGETK